jgi:hypothetical protein
MRSKRNREKKYIIKNEQYWQNYNFGKAKDGIRKYGY